MGACVWYGPANQTGTPAEAGWLNEYVVIVRHPWGPCNHWGWPADICVSSAKTDNCRKQVWANQSFSYQPLPMSPRSSFSDSQRQFYLCSSISYVQRQGQPDTVQYVPVLDACTFGPEAELPEVGCFQIFVTKAVSPLHCASWFNTVNWHLTLCVRWRYFSSLTPSSLPRLRTWPVPCRTSPGTGLFLDLRHPPHRFETDHAQSSNFIGTTLPPMSTLQVRSPRTPRFRSLIRAFGHPTLTHFYVSLSASSCTSQGSLWTFVHRS